MSTESASTSSFPTDEHPYVTLAKEIAGKYVGVTYTLSDDPPVDIEFEHIGSLWCWNWWAVVLKCELDGGDYVVIHDGTTGEVTDVVFPNKELEKEPNG